MVRIALRLLPEQGCFFREPTSVDSWTPGPKPLCHRHPTGPHPSGLLWTPATGESTKSNVALGCHRWTLAPPGRGRLVGVGRAEQHRLAERLAGELDRDRQA